MKLGNLLGVGFGIEFRVGFGVEGDLELGLWLVLVGVCGMGLSYKFYNHPNFVKEGIDTDVRVDSFGKVEIFWKKNK